MRAIEMTMRSRSRFTRLLEGIELLEHAGSGRRRYPARHTRALLVEDARGDEVKGVLLALVVVDGVAGVGAALAARDDVVLLRVTSGGGIGERDG